MKLSLALAPRGLLVRMPGCVGESADADPHFKAGKLDMSEIAMPMLPPDRRRGWQEARTFCLVDADIHQIRILILNPAAIGGMGDKLDAGQAARPSRSRTAPAKNHQKRITLSYVPNA